MKSSRSKQRFFSCMLVLPALFALVWISGCASSQQYRQMRREGQRAMLANMYGPARYFFQECDLVRPRQVENLHDLATCRIMLARELFQRQNPVAAVREVDAAVDYYSQALDVYPGHQASIEGKNIALELKGQFDEALAHAEWAAEFVGPRARQYVFLAQQREERGDVDGAMLGYRQAVAMEPGDVNAHVAFAKFLMRHGQGDEAVPLLQVAYQINPLDQWVFEQLSTRGAVPVLTKSASETP